MEEARKGIGGKVGEGNGREVRRRSDAEVRERNRGKGSEGKELIRKKEEIVEEG